MISFAGGDLSESGVVFGSSVTAEAPNGFTINGAATASGTAVGLILNNNSTLSTGDLLLSLRNNGTQQLSVSYAGTLTAHSLIADAGYLSVTGMTTPVNATFTAGAGTLATATYYYRVAATNAVGTTLASTETSLAVTGPAGVNVNWAVIPGATGYKVYGRSTGAELLMATITSGNTVTWLDDGSATPSGALPSTNTSAASTMAGSFAMAQNSVISLNTAKTHLIYSDGSNILLQGAQIYNNSGGFITEGDVQSATFTSRTNASTSAVLKGNITDGAAVIANKIQNANSLANNTAQVVGFYKDAGTTQVSAINASNGGLQIGSGGGPWATFRASGASTFVSSAVNDGATAVGLYIGGANTLSTAGAKIVGFYPNNLTTEKLAIGKNGQFIAPTGTADAVVGTATLVNGTVTVSTTAVTAASIIFLSLNTPGGTTGSNYAAPVASITAATSFVINAVGLTGATVATDTSTVNWHIFN